MKIALIGQKGLPAKQGGIERHVEELSVRLAEAGFAVSVYNRNYYASSKAKNYKKVRLIHLPSFRTKNLDAISHTFLATIHALFCDYNIIHYHGVGPSLLSWLPRIFKPKTKVIATLHCLDRQHQKWSKPAKFMLALGEKCACKFPHQTIVVSKTLQKYCKYRFDKETAYIPNGVSLYDGPSDEKILKDYGLVKDGYIFCASRLVRHKGLHTLIEAYKKTASDKKLVIAGTGANTADYVQELRRLAEDHKNIIFVGEQTAGRLKALFVNAYLFVQPSEAEGLSIALLEALSYAVPVIASDIEENMEVLSDWSLTFKNKNAADLARQLNWALANPAKIKNGALAAKTAIDKDYDWSKITVQTIDLYQKQFLPAYNKELAEADLK